MSLLLAEALPEVARELAQLLEKEGHADLAVQVPRLAIRDRCRCGDDFCSMFYTAAPPSGAWGAGHENIALEPENGMMILDVLNGKIMAVELLYRDDVRGRLLDLLP